MEKMFVEASLCCFGLAFELISVSRTFKADHKLLAKLARESGFGVGHKGSGKIATCYGAKYIYLIFILYPVDILYFSIVVSGVIVMSEREAYPSEKADKFLLRLPDGMRDKLKQSAKAASRTMNAEVVARLEGSFTGLPAASGAAPVMSHKDFLVVSDARELLDKIPAELASQYGLYIYRAELDRVREQMEDAEAMFQERYERLQKVLISDVSEARKQAEGRKVSELQQRINELKNAEFGLQSAISAIHTYRKFSGFPELRNVTSISTSVELI